MGGRGSGRWRDHVKRPVVEEARQLDVAAFEPALQHDRTTGILRWTDPRTEEVAAEFVFSLGSAVEGGTRRLLIEPTSEGRKQSFQLERARLGWHPGWLFRCPSDCGRRSRRLYALPRWMTFTCRHCGGLTYRSSQQHDSRLDLARRDPVGFIQSRARAPKTDRSRMVTNWLVMDAMNTHRAGRGWGRHAVTSGTRAIAQMHQEFRDKWRFGLTDVARIARGG